MHTYIATCELLKFIAPYTHKLNLFHHYRCDRKLNLRFLPSLFLWILVEFLLLFLHFFFFLPSIFVLVQESFSICTTHNGALLEGDHHVGILWYGKFSPPQKSIIVDFLASLDGEAAAPGMKAPTVSKCAWPFHQPIYGPQTKPLIVPNGDVGVDGMIVNIGILIAGAVTNPFKNGYFQGSAGAPLEAAKGAYPGYAGNLLVDSTGGGSYNPLGVNGRKYLLPALFDPNTWQCSTMV